MTLEEKNNLKQIYEERLVPLPVGTEFKNYKIFCEKMGIPIKESCSKEAQLKVASRYCRIEHFKQSLIIKGKYDPDPSPIETVSVKKKADKIIKVRKKTLRGYMRKLILKIVSQFPDTPIFVSPINLLYWMGAINEYGVIGYYDATEIIANLDDKIHPFEINNFYRNIFNLIITQLKILLIDMDKKNEINFQDAYIIFDKYGKISEATLEEDEYIKKHISDSLKEHGYISSFQALRCNKYKPIIKEVINDFSHDIKPIIKIFKVYKIQCVYDAQVLTDEEFGIYQNEIQNMVYKKSLEYADKEDAKRKDENGNYKEINGFTVPENYTQVEKSLCDRLILETSEKPTLDFIKNTVNSGIQMQFK